MEAIKTIWAEVDEQGRLVIPQEIVDGYGLQTGVRVRLEQGENDIRIHRPVTQLTKVYIEPTNCCNLDCTICMRNVWDEKPGRMNQQIFEHILQSLQDFSPLPTVFFGGIGEPLFHPRTIEWISRLKAIGAHVELITNGTLLNEEKTHQVIDSGLDVLWVSIDGATPESYADVRLGAELPTVLNNLTSLSRMRPGGHRPHPQIGIAFVAMKRNINELPDVLKIGRRLRAKYFSVSNLLPYTELMQDQILYKHTLKNLAYMPSQWLRHLNMPKMDLDELTYSAFFQALSSGYNVTFAGNNLGGANDVCKFIESGSLSIGWRGDISPCPPLLHTHLTLLNGRPRLNTQHIIGNIQERSLKDLWLDSGYVAYRERVQRFAFAPCAYCGGCEMAFENQEDCFLNSHPACGGCLWAQGIIQCP